MVLVSLWKIFVSSFAKEKENDLNYTEEIIKIFKKESEDIHTLKNYERKILSYLDPEHFTLDLINFIINSGVKFEINDVLEFDDDFIDFINDYISTHIRDNDLEMKPRILRHIIENDTVIIGSYKRIEFFEKLVKIGLINSRPNFELDDKINEDELEDIKVKNPTYTFLLSLSPYRAKSNLILYYALQLKSSIYSVEAIIAKLININPQYYSIIFFFLTIDEIMGENFSEKNIDLLRFVEFDFTLYNRIKDCVDIPLEDLKKYLLNITNHHQIMSETERIRCAITEKLYRTNIKNYCYYIDILNNHNFVKKISYRGDLILIVLAMKMVIGDKIDDVREDLIEDIFISICMLFGKKTNISQVHNPNLFYPNPFSNENNNIKLPFEKIGLALLMFKYFDHLNDNILENRILILNLIRIEFDNVKKNSNGIKIDNLLKLISSNIVRPLILDNVDIRNNDIYRFGVNIHNEERDKRTYQAIRAYVDTCHLSNQELDRLFTEFWEYKDKLSSEQKEDFLRVLGVDEHLNPKIYNRGDFGGLLNGRVILSFRGENYGDFDPKKLLGYFWNFANTYIEPRAGGNEAIINSERENIKHAILTGIISALQHDGNDIRNDSRERYHVVCNPGKLQRIVAATLSGRFMIDGRPVDVDNVILVDQEIEEGQYISNINDIYGHLKRFFNSQLQRTSETAEDFITDLFVYVEDLYKNNILLNPIYVIYVVMLVTNSLDGIVIDPTFSPFSNYDSIIKLDEIGKQQIVLDDIAEFERQHPEIVENRLKREKEREKQRKNEEERRKFREEQKKKYSVV